MSRRLADILERAARVAAPAALALFVLIGVVLSDQPLPLAVVAGVVAVALGLALAAVSPKDWVLVGLRWCDRWPMVTRSVPVAILNR